MGKNNLQKALEEFGCTILNYTENKILTWNFQSEARYGEFLTGALCHQGNGAYTFDEAIEINKLDDGKLVVFQYNGIEDQKYKFITLFKATIEKSIE